MSPGEYEQTCRGVIGLLERLRELEASLAYLNRCTAAGQFNDVPTLKDTGQRLLRIQIGNGWQLLMQTLSKMQEFDDAAEDERIAAEKSKADAARKAKKKKAKKKTRKKAAKKSKKRNRSR